jgi:putative membrane protein
MASIPSKFLEFLNPSRVLIILYIVGFFGVTIPIHEDFMLLTPINLLTTFFIALYADKNKKTALYLALLLCYVFGLVIELIGVHNEFLFGKYAYGATLGTKIFDTPLIIGINWAMLVYASTSFTNKYFKSYNLLIKSALGALIMVALDILIEPVAVNYDFWTWSNPPINELIVAPLRNYITWYLAAFLLNILFHKLAPQTQNNVIELLFILQMLFFAWINLFVI